MTGDTIPDSDHLSRYCKRPHIDSKGRPASVAFELRCEYGKSREPEEYLSVNWLEILDTENRANAMDRVRQAFKRKNYRVKPSGCFAIINVGKTLSYVKSESEDSRQLWFRRVDHVQSGMDPSHSGIYGYTYEDNLVAELIADTVTGTYPAIST